MLKAGFARIDVTPPLGTFVAGYFERRYASGVLDPIELNAIALSDEKETVLLVTADFLGIRAVYTDLIRERIAERIRIPADHILICSLHQHTSIVLRDDTNNTVVRDTAYLDVLYRKFCDVAQMAVADMSDTSLLLGERQADVPISFIRRYVMKNGEVATNPKLHRVREIVAPADRSDNTVRLLRFKRSVGKEIALVNFSTHPDVIGGDRFSADWPGFVRRFVEAEIPNTSCLLVNGAQGDSNHHDRMNGKREKGYEYSRYMGRVITDSVIELWDRAVPQETEAVKAGISDVYQKTRTDGAECYEECRKLLDDYDAGAVDRAAVSGAELARARRIVNMRTDPIFRRVPVSVISLGRVAFVGFGGEPFTHYATAVREACPDRYIVAVCCANGFEGYLPTAAAFEEGGYETSGSVFLPSLEQDCVTAATVLLAQ